MMLMPEEPGSEPLEQENTLSDRRKDRPLDSGSRGAEIRQRDRRRAGNHGEHCRYCQRAVRFGISRPQNGKSNCGGRCRKAAQKLLYTEIFAQEALQNIEAHAKESLIAMEEGDSSG